MNRLTKTGIGIAAGAAGTYLMGTAAMDLLLSSPAEVHRAVEKCAVQLGPVAVKHADLPSDCKDFSESFNSTTTTINITRNGNAHETSHTVYDLPPRSYFTAEQEESAKKNERANRLLRNVGYPLLGAAIGGVMGGLTGGLGNRQELPQAHDTPDVVATE